MKILTQKCSNLVELDKFFKLSKVFVTKIGFDTAENELSKSWVHA